MPLDPMLVVAIASVLTAFAGWIRGRSVGREQGRQEGISMRPPKQVVRVVQLEGHGKATDYCAQCGHLMDVVEGKAQEHEHPPPVHRIKIQRDEL